MMPSYGKESACTMGDLGLIPGLGRSPGEGKGYPLQYSDLENSMDCIDHGVAKSRTRLSNFPHSQRNSKCQYVNGGRKDLFFKDTIEKESDVAQSCLTLCNPMDCSLPASSIHEIFQARILESVAISFSRGSFQPRDQTPISHTAGRLFAIWATREALKDTIVTS